MPCYDPPPEWEGDARKNAEEAVRLLCDQVETRLRGSNGLVSVPPAELLRWYLAHRKIDLRIALDPRMGKKWEAADISQDIIRIEKWLGVAEKYESVEIRFLSPVPPVGE